MKKYLYFVIFLSVLFFSYTSFAQLRPVVPPLPNVEPLPDSNNFSNMNYPLPSTVSATVKGEFKILALDKKKNSKLLFINW